ncbi:hypothetical protein H9P43_006228 [Blastocladiella emersonii ATCC 22665]|nr:hypothetical protein H9P43_006228 [Blastocladiella emersonii ATCC 22665]
MESTPTINELHYTADAGLSSPGSPPTGSPDALDVKHSPGHPSPHHHTQVHSLLHSTSPVGSGPIPHRRHAAPLRPDFHHPLAPIAPDASAHRPDGTNQPPAPHSHIWGLPHGHGHGHGHAHGHTNNSRSMSYRSGMDGRAHTGSDWGGQSDERTASPDLLSWSQRGPRNSGNAAAAHAHGVRVRGEEVREHRATLDAAPVGTVAWTFDDPYAGDFNRDFD